MAKPPPNFPVPQVHLALETYINPRPVALEKRQVLDVLVQEICSDLDNCRAVPTRAEFEILLDEKLGRVRVRDRGKGVRGKFGYRKSGEEEQAEAGGAVDCPRREYLRAYRDRMEARRNWEAICAEDEGDESSAEEDVYEEEEVDKEESDFSNLFANALSLRTTLQSLIILRDYLAEFVSLLDQQPPELPTDLKLSLPGPPAELNSSTQTADKTSSARSSNLLLPLQSQIYDVARDISALRKLPAQELVPGTGDKMRALLETRAELIAWMEENIPSDFGGDNSKDSEKDDAPSPETQKKSTAQLEQAYANYCSEREALCIMQQRLSSVPAIPNLMGLTFSDPYSESKEAPGTPKRKPSLAGTNTITEPLYPHLHALTRTLPQLLSRHKSLVQDKSAIETSLSANSLAVKELLSQHIRIEDAEEPSTKPTKAWTEGLAVQRSKVQSEVREILKKAEVSIKEAEEAVGNVKEIVGEGDGGWEEIDGGVGVIGGGI